MRQLDAVGQRLAGDPLATLSFGTGPLARQGDVDRCYALAAEMLASADRAARVTGALRRGRLPRAGWWQDIARAALRADHRTTDGAASICVAAELSDRAQAYRRAEDQRRKTANGQRARAALTWVGEQFTRNPTGRQRVFVTPRVIAGLLFVLIPIASLEPVSYGIVYTSSHPLNLKVMTVAAQFRHATRAYTRWAPDFLTPWLTGHWHTDIWKVYAAYPVVLLLALAFVRRSRGGSAVRSWLALPAVIIGTIFAAGLVGHLLNTSGLDLWADVGGLGFAVVVAPLVSLVAIRVVAGRAR